MDKPLLILIVFLVFLTNINIIVFCWKKESPKPPTINNTLDVIIKPGFSEIKIKETPLHEEPNWQNYPPLRSVLNLGKVLGDIESHMPVGHIYRSSDKVTWAHETTHGINSDLRQKHGTGFNCFYCLNNRYVVIQESKVTLSQVAANTPTSLRDPSTFQLYLVHSRRDWGKIPLYICDEWVAYTNGGETQRELQLPGRNDTLQFMSYFDVYALSLAKTIKEQDPTYDDTEFKRFLRWNLERSFRLIGSDEKAKTYLNKLKTNVDAKDLRAFVKSYLGDEWTLKYLDF